MAEKRRHEGDEFKREAVRLVTEQGYGVSETARNLGINAHMASVLHKAVTRAATQAGLDQTIGGQILRHRGATHRLEHGVNIRVRQTRLGHAEVKTTEISTPVIAQDIRP